MRIAPQGREHEGTEVADGVVILPSHYSHELNTPSVPGSELRVFFLEQLIQSSQQPCEASIISPVF